MSCVFKKQDQKYAHFSFSVCTCVFVFSSSILKRTVIHILLSYLCVCACVCSREEFLFNPFFKNSTIQHITYNIILAFCFIVYTGLFLSLFSCILDKGKKAMHLLLLLLNFVFVFFFSSHSYQIDECLFVYTFMIVRFLMKLVHLYR